MLHIETPVVTVCLRHSKTSTYVVALYLNLPIYLLAIYMQTVFTVFSLCYVHMPGYAVAQLVEALCCKLEGRRFDSPWCHWSFSLT